MKIMVLECVCPLTDGKILSRLLPLSMISLQASKNHFSKAPKSEPFLHATSSGHGFATPVHTETASPITLVLQTTSTQHEQSSHQDDSRVFCLLVYISVLPSLKKFSSPTTIKFKCISQPSRHSQMLLNKSWGTTFSYSCQKEGEIAYSKGESNTRKRISAQ